MEIVVITGMSGAGKSQAMKVMEDMGYYCMDNLPPQLLSKFAELTYKSTKHIDKACVVVDIRGGEFFKSLYEELEKLSNMKIDYKVVFLDASDEVLIKRFKELRRPHPLNSQGSIIDGIREEREALKDIKSKADYIIDTSNLNLGMLKAEMTKIFLKGEKREKITLVIASFGFKNGILLDADMVFDVRFIPNPYYIPELKEHSGNEKMVRDYVFKWPQTNIFLLKTIDLIEFLIPYYIDEGKSQLVIGIGCTGGKHRSVSIAEELANELSERGHSTMLYHRDLK
ncbi:RNase adapter RapZ [Soehngenia saccharolytica]|nr:RNase adapter RapZ [Soehngenia saccharolytica]